MYTDQENCSSLYPCVQKKPRLLQEDLSAAVTLDFNRKGLDIPEIGRRPRSY